MQVCVGIGVEKNDYYAYSIKQRCGLDTASFCLQRVVAACHKHYRLITDPTPLNFVFDDSEKDAPKVYHAWSTLKKRHQLPRNFVASITFAEDHVFYPLQAADLLACGLVQEHQRETDKWGAGSPFTPLFREAPNPPPGMAVETEYWDSESLIRHKVFGGAPERP